MATCLPIRKGWVLDAICRELAVQLPHRNIEVIYTGGPTNPVAHYFFPHYQEMARLLLRSPVIRKSRSVVLFTHPSNYEGITDAEIGYLFRTASQIICMNSSDVSMVVERYSVPSSKVCYEIVGVEADLFSIQSRRASRTIGLSQAYYPRKSPELLLRVVEAMPDVPFLLLGRNWRQWSRFTDLSRLANFEYVEAPYEQYPALYGRMDVFLSLARLEGGPIPLLEAMASNVVPVASRTGFAPDIIDHGHNGFLFDLDGATVDDIERLLRLGLECPADVRSTVLKYSWQRFARAVEERLF